MPIPKINLHVTSSSDVSTITVFSDYGMSVTPTNEVVSLTVETGQPEIISVTPEIIIPGLIITPSERIIGVNVTPEPSVLLVNTETATPVTVNTGIQDFSLSSSYAFTAQTAINTVGTIESASYVDLQEQAQFVAVSGALNVLEQTYNTGSFTGSFKGNAILNSIYTEDTSNLFSELLIGNINPTKKQVTRFRNTDLDIDGIIVFRPRFETPEFVTGGMYYSASGDFFLGLI